MRAIARFTPRNWFIICNGKYFYGKRRTQTLNFDLNLCCFSSFSLSLSFCSIIFLHISVIERLKCNFIQMKFHVAAAVYFLFFACSFLCALICYCFWIISLFVRAMAIFFRAAQHNIASLSVECDLVHVNEGKTNVFLCTFSFFTSLKPS